MKSQICACFLLGSSGTVNAFVPKYAWHSRARSPIRTQMSMREQEPQRQSTSILSAISSKLLGPLLIAYTTWSSAYSMVGFDARGAPIVRDAQVANAARPSNAPTSAGSRVNKDAESLLRWGLPIESKEARDLQETVEVIKDENRLKRFDKGKKAAQQAKTIISSKRDKLLAAVRADKKEEADGVLASLDAKLDELEKTFADDAGRGSEQERAKLDLAYTQQLQAARMISQVEELMVPADYKVNVPAEYANLPQLQGRAEVEMVIKKPTASEKFEVGGRLYDTVKVRMVVDGYNAPITGGNFVDLVNRGFYSGMKIQRSDGFVVQTGDPDPQGQIHGFKPSGSSGARTIPLEIFVTQDESPMYGFTTEDDGRGYSATRLPFQAYGTLGMAREEYTADSASSQVFWLLFESDLTPAGKNLLDGRYACFGYTIDNAELLAGVKEGDIITSAKVLRGLENLKAAG